MDNALVEKDWHYGGFRCVVVMQPRGHRCGYVGVPKGHPLYGAGYSEPLPILSERSEWLKGQSIGKRGVIPLLCRNIKNGISPDIFFDVHGGITFAGGDGKHPVPSDLWWFGYDCAHSGDARDLTVCDPATREMELKYPTGGVIRSLEYCMNECESLAAQIAALGAE